VAENRLGEIKGIGEALEKKITELVETGKLAYYERAESVHPAGAQLKCWKFPDWDEENPGAESKAGR